MLDLLDNFLIMSPTARSKWEALRPHQKELLSFLFFAAVLPVGTGNIKTLPALVIGTRTYARVTVDVPNGGLAVWICDDDYFLIDLYFDIQQDGEAPPPPQS